MITSDHWLKSASKMIAHDIGRSLRDPKFVVMHYTAGSSTSGAVASLTKRDEQYVSAHLVIGRDGAVVQCVPFNKQAYHAGKSQWGTYEGLNAYSIGIELVNPGWRRAGFMFPDWPTITCAHKNGGPVRAWFQYTEEQYAAVNLVLSELTGAYPTLLDAVGHDDIAPGRKSDPGPAFDWTRVRL
jgi:N-acetylmuramoyl-L-alanine amidase